MTINKLTAGSKGNPFNSKGKDVAESVNALIDFSEDLQSEESSKGASNVGYQQGRAPAVHTNTVVDRLKAGTAKLKSDFGAIANGSADDTNAFNNWWDALMDVTYQRRPSEAGEIPFFVQKGPALSLESGVYVYSGSGLNIENSDSFVFNMKGQDPLSTKILIESDAYLFDFDNNPVFSQAKNFSTNGGKGVVRYKSKNRTVARTHTFRDIHASMYTEAAISNNAVDLPYFRVEDGMFYGDPSMETMGVVVSGLSAGGWIKGNVFGDNRYNIKLAVGDNGSEQNGPATPFNILMNDFYRTSLRGTKNTFDVWLQPGLTTNNSGRGIILNQNKFGQENLQVGDAHILIADAASGTELNGQKQHVTTKSTGFVSGFRCTDNNVNSQSSAARIPYILSYSPNVGNIKIDDIFDNAMPTNIIEFAGGITQPEIGNLARTNVFDASGCMALQESDEPIKLSNLEGVFQLIDPLNAFAGNQQTWNRNGNGETTDFIWLYNAITSVGSAISNATKSAIDNSYGAPNEAIEATLTATDGRIVFSVSGATAGKQTFLYLEMKKSSTTPLNTAIVEIRNADGGFLQARRMILLDSLGAWQPVLIPFNPNGSTFQIRIRSNNYSAGVRTNFQLGNVKCYHNTSPILTSHLKSIGSSWSDQHLVMGDYHAWFDGNGLIRYKTGYPTSASDGQSVGRLPEITTRGDGNVTLTVNSLEVQRFATTLTANRTVTLDATGAYNGLRFRIVRAAAGAFNLGVGGLTALLENEWCEVGWDGSAFVLTARGSLT